MCYFNIQVRIGRVSNQIPLNKHLGRYHYISVTLVPLCLSTAYVLWHKIYVFETGGETVKLVTLQLAQYRVKWRAFVNLSVT